MFKIIAQHDPISALIVSLWVVKQNIFSKLSLNSKLLSYLRKGRGWMTDIMEITTCRLQKFPAKIEQKLTF